MEFIKEVRINRAIELIKTGEYSMTQVAYMVGINDPHYFSKGFKAKMGMPHRVPRQAEAAVIPPLQ